ncbi:MAG: helix-turn-helix domain-containing protein [Actinophytocola sp.]|nr:helix-turn-helix domain-containing protein [Actinophytocola sp.]
MVEHAAASVREWDFPRSAASVLLMTRFAAERGIGHEDMLRGSALTLAEAEDPDTQIDAHQELAVVRNLVTHRGAEPGLGLRVGARYQVTTFGIFGFACVSSPTLRDVISFALRYWDLSFAFGIPEVEIGDFEIRIELHDDAVPGQLRRFLVERDLAAMYTIMNDLLPMGVPIRTLEFAFPAPASRSELDDYLAAFGVAPDFDRPAHVSTFDVAYLDKPLPQANAQTVALCEAQCRELVARRRARTGISHDVRERLINLGGADTGMDAVAAELNVSTRTLRRKLSEAGTSYRMLLDEVREALAEEMLATGALSVSDVAVRLGYAEATSFIHAFKRWKGTTPAAYTRPKRC